MKLFKKSKPNDEFTEQLVNLLVELTYDIEDLEIAAINYGQVQGTHNIHTSQERHRILTEQRLHVQYVINAIRDLI